MLKYLRFATFSGTKASDNKTDFSLILEKKMMKRFLFFSVMVKFMETGAAHGKSAEVFSKV